MSQSMNVRLALALAITVTVGSCSSGGTSDIDVASAPDSGVAGELNGQPITLAELDEWIRHDLFRQKSLSTKALYELRAESIERMINERMVDAAAAKVGLGADDWMEREVAALGPVSDEQIAAFYADNQARLARRGDLETMTPKIREFLESERPKVILAELREKADIEIVLDPPRFQVADTGPSRGPQTAPITIVEFSDYECPFCGRAEPVLQEVLDRYPGQVRIVYRHLPLSFHKNARPAAAAAICAEEQDKFWEYHARLFENQRKLATDDLAQYAAELELDLERWNACIESDETNARVDADLAEARALGASGTPAFFINGISLSGALPAEDFARVIDAELARLADDESAS